MRPIRVNRASYCRAGTIRFNLPWATKRPDQREHPGARDPVACECLDGQALHLEKQRGRTAKRPCPPVGCRRRPFAVPSMILNCPMKIRARVRKILEAIERISEERGDANSHCFRRTSTAVGFEGVQVTPTSLLPSSSLFWKRNREAVIAKNTAKCLYISDRSRSPSSSIASRRFAANFAR